MKGIKIDLPSEHEEIKIVPLADFHIGDEYSDFIYIKQLLEQVKNDKNTYVILNGDLMNTAIKSSVSDIYGEMYSPMQELSICESLFKPISDRILCITEGNHERRVAKDTGIEMTRILAKQLGVEDRYSEASALIFLRFGEMSQPRTDGKGKRKVCYTINVNHGSGGGRTAGAKANALTRMASIIDADIYIHSHTHLPMVLKESFFRTDVRNSSIEQVDKLFVNTSAMLGYGGYGEIYEYKPASKTVPLITLNGKKKEATATL